jgi:hypothetical protein
MAWGSRDLTPSLREKRGSHEARGCSAGIGHRHIPRGRLTAFRYVWIPRLLGEGRTDLSRRGQRKERCTLRRRRQRWSVGRLDAFPYSRKEELLAVLTQMFGPPPAKATPKSGQVRYLWPIKGSLGASVTDDRTTQHPMLWLTIGTANYAIAAAASKCAMGSVVAHP